MRWFGHFGKTTAGSHVGNLNAARIVPVHLG
jgi:hypothetical protein